MQRLQHIDFMKGVAIFLVVLGHVYQLSLNNCGTMFKFIYLFHMPFFFMLSGYFAYRTNLTLYHFKKKTVRLLVPFFGVGLLYAFTHHLIRPFLFNEFHAGYWFLWSLWSCWLLFFGIQWLILKLNIKSPWLEIPLLILPFALSKIIHYDWTPSLSFSFTFAFYRFFILGYIIGKYKIVEHFLNRPMTTATCIIIFLCSFLFINHQIINLIPMTLVQLVLCLSLFSLLCYVNSICAPNISKYIIEMGKNSLCIYVFHYFIIYYFVCDTLKLSSGWEFCFAVSITALIIVLTFLLSMLFAENIWLRRLFLGKND